MEYTVVREALIEVEGRQTKVDGNGIGDGDQRYGLYTCDTSSIIHYSSSLSRKNLFPQTTIVVATMVAVVVQLQSLTVMAPSFK